LLQFLVGGRPIKVVRGMGQAAVVTDQIKLLAAVPCAAWLIRKSS
jgi:hypothetical protein